MLKPHPEIYIRAGCLVDISHSRYGFSLLPFLHRRIDTIHKLSVQRYELTNQSLVNSIWTIHEWSKPTGQEDLRQTFAIVWEIGDGTKPAKALAKYRPFAIFGFLLVSDKDFANSLTVLHYVHKKSNENLYPWPSHTGHHQCYQRGSSSGTPLFRHQLKEK